MLALHLSMPIWKVHVLNYNILRDCDIIYLDGKVTFYKSVS